MVRPVSLQGFQKGFHLGVSGGFRFSSGNYVFVSNTSVGNTTKSLPEEIAEKMSYELNKRDWHMVLEKLDTLMMMNVADGRISKADWDKKRAKIYACLGMNQSKA